MQRVLQLVCEWSKCLSFKESKSAVLAIDAKGKASDPNLYLNGKKIPSLSTKPFKFLGKWIYPSLKDTENVLKKTDALILDGRKKCWIYQYSILPYLTWDFMMFEINTTVMDKLEAVVNKYLKKWLKLMRTADPSILYRGSFGLNITNIRNAVMAARPGKYRDHTLY